MWRAMRPGGKAEAEAISTPACCTRALSALRVTRRLTLVKLVPSVSRIPPSLQRQVRHAHRLCSESTLCHPQVAPRWVLDPTRARFSPQELEVKLRRSVNEWLPMRLVESGHLCCTQVGHGGKGELSAERKAGAQREAQGRAAQAARAATCPAPALLWLLAPGENSRSHRIQLLFFLNHLNFILVLIA